MSNCDWQTTVQFLQRAFQDDKQLEVLQLLLTTDERNALSTRVKIIQYLLDGSLNQRQLKDKLGIGIATVTRGSNELKEIDSDFRVWLDKILIQSKRIQYK